MRIRDDSMRRMLGGNFGAGAGAGDRIQPARIGVRITRTDAGTNARRIGLRPGDVILTYAEKPVTNAREVIDLINAHRLDQDEIAIVVWRNGAELMLKARPGGLGMVMTTRGVLVR